MQQERTKLAQERLALAGRANQAGMTELSDEIDRVELEADMISEAIQARQEEVTCVA